MDHLWVAELVRCGVRQTEIAKLAGVTPGRISQVARGDDGGLSPDGIRAIWRAHGAKLRAAGFRLRRESIERLSIRPGKRAA